MVFCEVCGNEIAPDQQVWPFCRSSQEISVETQPPSRLHKTVNIEQGRPVAETAVARLLMEIGVARQERIQLLTIIHGYGSSGKGGVIRIECRKNLDYLVSIGKIECFIPGEEFSRRSKVVKMLLQRFPDLIHNRNINRGNRGVTLVVL